MIYASRNYYQAFLAGYFDGYPLWVANYQQFPTPSDPALDRDWDFWQFSNTGQVKGIEGPVDLDVFRGGFADLQRLCQPLADTATAGGAVP
jgi:lysozyme